MLFTACRGALQRELLEFALTVEEMTSLEVEHVACGNGLLKIYRFLCHKNGVHPELNVRSLLLQSVNIISQ